MSQNTFVLNEASTGEPAQGAVCGIASADETKRSRTEHEGSGQANK